MMYERLNWRSRALCGLVLGGVALNFTARTEQPRLNTEIPAVVIDKEYDDPDTWTVMVGNKPNMHYDPARYYLKLRQCQEVYDSQADSNSCVTVTEEVSEKIYEAYPVSSNITTNERK